MSHELLELARRRAGLTQGQLAEMAETSRPTLSAYESGRKSPTLVTVERILKVAGFALSLEPQVTFTTHQDKRGKPFDVPDRLWHIPIEDAFATVVLPTRVFWSPAGEPWDLSDRRARGRCYEVVLQEGLPEDFLRYIDGALLVDVWPDMFVPREIHDQWQPLIERYKQ